MGDYMVLVLGHSLFAILRLMFLAMMCIHLFACVFYRIKKDGAASEDDVIAFYKFFRVDSTVRCILT
jgi:hypothetical protein